jgi:hypothetical protein
VKNERSTLSSASALGSGFNSTTVVDRDTRPWAGIVRCRMFESANVSD